MQQVRWQGISGEILEEELIPMGYKNGAFEKIEHKDMSEILLDIWSSSQGNPEGMKDDEAHNIAKKIAPSLEKIMQDDVSINKSPSSIFTFSACRNSSVTN